MQESWNTAKLHPPEAQTSINEISGSGQPNNTMVKKSTMYDISLLQRTNCNCDFYKNDGALKT